VSDRPGSRATFVVDRRPNGSARSEVNRQRFLARYRQRIRRAVEAAVQRRSIRDMDRGESVTIPADDVSEPVFTHGSGGTRTRVYAGNREFVAGDRLPRPEGGGGAGSRAARDGEGEDAFGFELTREEFLDFIFDGLALPNLVKRHLAGSDAWTRARAGFATDGVPAALNIVRSFRAARGRRIALAGGARRRLAAALARLQDALARGASPGDLAVLRAEVEALRRRIRRVPFLDSVDLRYNLHVRRPQPAAKAVMFCLMDVSGSMDQEIKDLAKRFFLLLYLFLARHYAHTEVVFIRHHTTAKEVDEQEFFHSRETGGTVVSSALRLMREVVAARYAAPEWNIYGAQASDGDNWHDDSPLCGELLEALLPQLQYFAYVEISRREPQALWDAYGELEERFAGSFGRRRIGDAADIYPVFRALFEQRAAA
jgi:hypothetical protein